MGKLVEVNQSVGIGIKLYDGATNQFPRFRIYNAAGAEQTAAPFNSPIDPTHRVNGFYSASFTPDVEGEFFITKRVFSDAGRTTLNKKYEEIMEVIEVRSVDQDLATLLSRLTAPRAANLDNLDAAITSRQSESDALSRYTNLIAEHDDTQSRISAIQNNTNFVGVVPPTLILPIAGSKTYRIFANLYDTTNNPEDPDANTLNIRIEDPTGTPLVGTTAMTRDAVGRYHYDYVVNSTDTEQPLRVFFEYEESAIAIQHVRTTEVREFETKLDDIISKIGVPSGASISADIASVKTDTGSLVNDNGLDLTIPSAVVRPPSGTRSDKFYARLLNGTGKHADPDSNILNIRVEKPDGTILIATTPMTRTGVGRYEYTKTTEFDDEFGQRIVFFEYDYSTQPIQYVKTYEVVSADVGAIDAQLDSIETKIDLLPDNIWDEPSGDHAGPGTTGKALIDAGESAATPSEIADAVWDEARTGHNGVGTFGEQLDAKISSRESEASASSRASAAAKETTVNAGFAAGAKDATVAKEGTLQTKASQSSVNTVSTKADSIKSKTDQLIFDGDKVRSNAATVGDKTGYTLTASEKNDIADRVWDETESSHTTAGTFGKALSDAKAATDPLAIADAVWDENASEHAAPSSMGGKLNEARNESASNGVKNDTLLSRLTSARAALLDNLNAPISSLETDSAAAVRFNDIVADIASMVTILNGIAGDVSGSDPDNLSILQLLNSGTFGLAQLRIQLDAKSTLAQMVDVFNDLTTIINAINDGGNGLAAIKTQTVANNTQLVDTDHGLAKLRTELDKKVESNELDALPTAAEIVDAVWNELTSDPRAAGSYGALVKSNLDAKITTRATNTDLATVDTVVDQIKALLENVTYGLSALKDEIDVNEGKIDANNAAITNVDGDLATARADILAAIAAIVNGTPTILAAIDTLKGAGYSEAADSLKAISDKIAAGTATLANQTSIINKLNDMHGTAPGASDNIKSIRTKVEQNISETQANNTQIRGDVADVETKVDGITSEVAAVKARLDDTNFGLSKAKTDRDNYRSDILAGQGTQNSKLDTISAKADVISGKVDSSEAAILAAVNALDVSLINTNVQGIIALLQDGTNGLSAIKNAVTQVKNQEAANSSQVVGDIDALDTKVDSLSALVTAIQGVGFSASHSLVAIKAAIESIDVENDDFALETSVQAILTELNKIKDGQTATFDGTQHSLKKIAEQGSQLTGFEGGEG